MPTVSVEGTKLRSTPGRLERYYITKYLLRCEACVIIAAEYISSPPIPLLPATLFPALREVIQTHAALGITIQDVSTNHPTFVRLKNVDLSRVVEYANFGTDPCPGKDLGGLQTVMEAQFQKPFDVQIDMPLWRVVVLTDNTVVFVWHHVMADGLSGLVFHDDLLAALRDSPDASSSSLQHSNSTVNLVAIPTTTYLAPSVESVVDVAPSFSKIVREFYATFAPTSWTKGASAWTGNPVRRHPGIGLNTHVRMFGFSSSETRRLLDVCRKHDVTLTSAFHEILITALSSVIVQSQNSESLESNNHVLLRSNPKRKPTTIPSSIAISLRRFSQTPANVFCDQVSVYHSFPSIVYPSSSPSLTSTSASSISWSAAARLTSIFRAGGRELREHIGLLKYLFGHYDVLFQGMEGKKRQDGLVLTNLGVFVPGGSGGEGGTATAHFPEEQEQECEPLPRTRWSIRDVTFAQCEVPTGPAINVNLVGTPAGGLSATLTWPDAAVEEDFAERFMGEVGKVLRGVLDEEVDGE